MCNHGDITRVHYFVDNGDFHSISNKSWSDVINTDNFSLSKNKGLISLFCSAKNKNSLINKKKSLLTLLTFWSLEEEAAQG